MISVAGARFGNAAARGDTIKNRLAPFRRPRRTGALQDASIELIIDC